MAARPPQITRSSSEKPIIHSTINVHGHFFHSTGDLTSITGGSDSTNYAGIKADGDSSSQFGTVYASRDTTSALFVQSSTLHNQSHPGLCTPPRQQLVPHSTASAPQISQELPGSLVEAKHFWAAGLEVGTFSVEDTAVTTSEIESLPCEVDEYNWVTEGSGKEEEEEEREGEAEYSEEEDDDGLEMATSSNRQVEKKQQNEFATVEHTIQPKTESNFWQLKPGHVISTFENENSQLSSRTMIIMAISNEPSLQCISLCLHPVLEPNPDDTSSHTHVKINTWSENMAQPIPGNVNVNIKFFSDNSKLLDGCWSNCQQVWTLRKDVKYAVEGKVTNFKDLVEAFSGIQKQLYKQIKANSH